MTTSPAFHLGWFLSGLGVPAWNQTWSGSSDHDWAQVFYDDMARSLDRARIDLMVFADSSNVKEVFSGGWDSTLKLGLSSLDPLAIAAVLARQTEGLGVVPTASVSDWNPWLLARLIGSMDELTGGRVGWNMVTGGAQLSANNVGYEVRPHDERYEVAHEFTEVVTKLWESWEPDAVVRDYATDTYADGSKVHRVGHVGQHFRSSGPLTTPRSPQGRPVLVQAGASPAGKDFAARYADVVVGPAYGGGVEGMKEYRRDLYERMAKYGREPGDVRIFFMVSPWLGNTEEEAQERYLKAHSAPENDKDMQQVLMSVSLHWGVDLSRLNLDEPVPAGLKTEGHQTELGDAIKSGKTLREIISGGAATYVDMVGTPESVASQMEAFQQEVGNDGFFFFRLFVDRRFIAEVTDGLVPVLQRRGLSRKEFASTKFRENLFSF